MKVAVTSKGPNLGDEVDPRFGRAPFILIVDMDSMAYEVLDNGENVRALKGAGIQAATAVSDKGAEVLLTGYCGPNAFKTCAAAGVKVVNDVSGPIKQALIAFNSGEFEYSEAANAEGHW